MTKEEAIAKIRNGVKWDSFPKERTGGQTVGVTPRGVEMRHDDYGFVIQVNDFRSRLQAREFCATVFEMYLQETKNWPK